MVIITDGGVVGVVIITVLFIIIGKQMFERDASLALSDARFLTEGKIFIKHTPCPLN